MKTLNKIAALGLMVVGMTFVGCMENTTPTSTSNSDAAAPVIQLKVGLDAVQSLGKGSLITLKKLIVVIGSTTTPDTIRDTITATTTPSLNTVSTLTGGQTINLVFPGMKPLRNYNVTATVKDNNDSVTHTMTRSIGILYDGDTALVNLSMSSRFTMYKASLLMPDSISSSVVGTFKEVINIKRLVMQIDGVNAKDTTDQTSTYYTPKVNAVINDDYVPVGSHTVVLEAFGPMVGPDSSWNIANPLYKSNSITLNVAAGSDSTFATNDTLIWQGPTTSTGNITAVIGKVGTVTINGLLPGSNLIP
jgi:hypothetical protein